jgi:hypothetical protein
MSTTTPLPVRETRLRLLLRTSRNSWPECLTVAGYAGLLGSLIPFHEPWADEAQAWQLAKSLPVSELFGHYLRYEGSPGFWHLLLRLLVKLHVTYAGMHWITGLIALAGVSLLVFLSPFPRYFRLTLPFTFFLAYQYAVVARSYVLVPLLLFALAATWTRRTPPPLLLGLLGNVSLHALSVSIGLALIFLFRVAPERGRRYLVASSSVLATFYSFAIFTVLPHPKDLNFQTWPPELNTVWWTVAVWLYRAINALLSSVASPLWLAIPVWFLVVRQFIKTDNSLYLLPLGTLVGFCGYYSNFWHVGLLVLTLITICWIRWDSVAIRGPVILTVVSACIALQIGWTIHAFAFDYKKSYSGDLEAARFLEPYVAAGELMAVTYFQQDRITAFHSIGLYPYFKQPIFINQPNPFWKWQNGQYSDAKFLEALQRKPAIVDAMLFETDTADFKKIDHPRISVTAILESQGYHVTKTFCGEKPEGFHQREKICHVIFMRSK